jgi:hypothetical protein
VLGMPRAHADHQEGAHGRACSRRLGSAPWPRLTWVSARACSARTWVKGTSVPATAARTLAVKREAGARPARTRHGMRPNTSPRCHWRCREGGGGLGSRARRPAQFDVIQRLGDSVWKAAPDWIVHAVFATCARGRRESWVACTRRVKALPVRTRAVYARRSVARARHVPERFRSASVGRWPLGTHTRGHTRAYASGARRTRGLGQRARERPHRAHPPSQPAATWCASRAR